MTDIFQPFTDRLSRDIRNELSTACAACLRQGEIEPAQRTAEPYLAAGLAECYTAYINDRLQRYRQAVAMAAGGSTDPIHQALILWNLGLFFESLYCWFEQLDSSFSTPIFGDPIDTTDV